MSNLQIKEISSENDWEKFNLNFSQASFLQSFGWGAFQQKLNKKVFYFGIFEDSKQVGSLLLVKEEAKRGSYFTLAGGPTLDWDNVVLSEKIFYFLTIELRRIAKKERCLFVRIRPQALDSAEMRLLFSKTGWILSPMHLTADLTLQLDLQDSEEEMLAQMRKNTRYEIRQAEKRGIIVKTSQNSDEITQFASHQNYLAKKHGFIPFSELFLKEQFKIFVEKDQAMLFHAYLEGKLLASAFVIFYNQEAVYHYGISTPENDRQPGAYACQWEAMKEAKKRGLKKYNFWGISPKDSLDHRFAGVSLFKRGFGGEEIQYLLAHDLRVDFRYYFVNFFEQIRKKIRKL